MVQPHKSDATPEAVRYSTGKQDKAVMIVKQLPMYLAPVEGFLGRVDSCPSYIHRGNIVSLAQAHHSM